MRQHYPSNSELIPLRSAYAAAFPGALGLESAEERELADHARKFFMHEAVALAAAVAIVLHLHASGHYMAALAASITAFLGAGILGEMRNGLRPLPKGMSEGVALLANRARWLARLAEGHRDVVRCQFGSRAMFQPLPTLPPEELVCRFAPLLLADRSSRRVLASPVWMRSPSSLPAIPANPLPEALLDETSELLESRGRIDGRSASSPPKRGVSMGFHATAQPEPPAIDAEAVLRSSKAMEAVSTLVAESAPDAARRPSANSRPYLTLLALDAPTFEAIVNDVFEPSDESRPTRMKRFVVLEIYKEFQLRGGHLNHAAFARRLAASVQKSFGSVGLTTKDDASWIDKAVRGTYQPVWGRLLAAGSKHRDSESRTTVA